MNTIKIYLEANGAVAHYEQAFDLYQYQYQSKLLEIYVPESICLNTFLDENNSAGTGVQLKMAYTDNQGHLKFSDIHYARMIKGGIVYNNVRYYLFSRLLPYDFTIYSGIGAQAPRLSVSVFNINEDNLIGITTTQEFPIDVNPSTPLMDGDEPIEPTPVQDLETAVNGLIIDIAKKQNIDLGAQTIRDIEAIIGEGLSPYKVEPSLVSLFYRTQQNANKDVAQDGRMDNMQAQIDAIAQAQITGVRIIGTLDWDTSVEATPLPTNQDLDNFRTSQGYTDATNGDIIYVNVIIAGATDKFYIASYKVSTQLWKLTEAQFLENASNSEKGIVKGTALSQSDTSKILFDIQDGVIVDALVYRDNAWVSIKSYFNTIDSITDLANPTPVPRAVADADGNPITSTYQTKQEGASKTYVKEYAMPKIVNDVNYMDFTNHELVANPVANANISIANIQPTDNELTYLNLNLNQDLDVGNKNGLMVSAYVQSSALIEGKIRVVLTYSLASESYATSYNLGHGETNTRQFEANTMYQFEVNARFSELNSVLHLSKQDRITATIYFYAEQSYNAQLDLIANLSKEGVAFIDRLAYIQYVVDTNDYNALQDKPILNIDLSNEAVADLPTNTIFRHIGASDATYSNGLLYFKKNALDVALLPLCEEWASKQYVANEIADLEIDITGLTNPLPSDVVTKMIATPRPVIKLSNMYFVPTHENSGNYYDWVRADQSSVTTFVLSYPSGRYTVSQYKNVLQWSIADEYSSNLTYKVGDIVMYATHLHKCKVEISTPENWTSAHWTSIQVASELENKVDYIDISGWTSPLTSAQLSILENAKMPILTNGVDVFFPKDLSIPFAYKFISQGGGDSVNRYILMEIDKIDGTITYHEPCVADDSAIAPVFSTLRTYAVGDLVTFGGDLYICTTAVTTAGDFDRDNWTLTNVKNEIKNTKVKANEVTFHQLVKNEYINYSVPYATSKQVTETFNTIGHKYYYKVSNTVNSVDISMLYADSSYERIVLAGNGSYEGIFTANASKTATYVSIFASNNGAVLTGFNIIDLTADYGAGQEPSLEECQKIYRVPYGYGENKISVLEDSKKITSFQTPIQAKVVSFNQLVPNEYVKGYTNTALGWKAFSSSLGVNSGDKVYCTINASNTRNPIVFGTSGTNNSQTIIDALDIVVNQKVGKIVTASGNYNYLNTYYEQANTTISEFNLVNLTQMFGAGQEPTLAQCQALFNADYYDYTSGKDMQLIYDGEKPIALVEIPQQYPQLIVDTTTSKAMVSGQDNVIYQIDLTKGKYMIIVTSELTTVESWFQLNDYINGNVRKTVAGPANNGGGLELTDYIEVQSTTTLYIRGYGYGSYTQYVRATVVKLG